MRPCIVHGCRISVTHGSHCHDHRLADIRERRAGGYDPATVNIVTPSGRPLVAGWP